jgi:hypothetical protein
VNADADLQGAWEAEVEVMQGRENLQAGPYGPLGVIFMGRGIAEVHQQPVAQVLGNVALIALDHCGTGLLISLYHLPQIFRVKLGGERGRAYQVTEQHRELAPLGVYRTWLCGWSRGLVGRKTGRGCGRFLLASPDQKAAVFIGRESLGANELFLEVFQILVIQGKPPL